MKENVKDDAERTTAQDAVRHPVSEEGVPVRNITFGDFLMEEAESLIQHLLSEGGATIHPISMEIRNWSQGYAVALNTGHGEYPFDGASSLREVFLSKLDSVRTEAAENNRYIGCWIETDDEGKTTFCFETSVFVNNRMQAMRLGVAESQRAIWDFKESRTIYLPTGEIKRLWLIEVLENLSLDLDDIDSYLESVKAKVQFKELRSRFFDALYQGDIKENISSLEEIADSMEEEYLVKDWIGFQMKVTLESMLDFTNSSDSDFNFVRKRINRVYRETQEILDSGNY